MRTTPDSDDLDSDDFGSMILAVTTLVQSATDKMQHTTERTFYHEDYLKSILCAMLVTLIASHFYWRIRRQVYLYQQERPQQRGG